MFLEISADLRDISLLEEYINFAFTENCRVSDCKAISFDNKFLLDVQVNLVLLNLIKTPPVNLLRTPSKCYSGAGELSFPVQYSLFTLCA
jgi:hypothetical protein